MAILTTTTTTSNKNSPSMISMDDLCLRKHHHSRSAPNLRPSSSMWSSFDVLLVDDNPMNRKVGSVVVKKMIRSRISAMKNIVPRSLSIDTVSDGLQAIAMVQRKQYDLILMDVHMPNCNGPEATLRIKELLHELRCRDIPIFALTTDHSKDTVQLCRASGMEHTILSKPIITRELGPILDRLLSGSNNNNNNNNLNNNNKDNNITIKNNNNNNNSVNDAAAEKQQQNPDTTTTTTSAT